jgi:hypothetical protein
VETPVNLLLEANQMRVPLRASSAKSSVWTPIGVIIQAHDKRRRAGEGSLALLA